MKKTMLMMLGLSLVAGLAHAQDLTLPTAPANLAVNGPTASTLPLTWTAATDNVGVTGYQVWVDGGLVASQATTAYTLTGLQPGTKYAVGVQALDAAGNASYLSWGTFYTASGEGTNSTDLSNLGEFTSLQVGDAAIPEGYLVAVSGDVLAEEVVVRFSSLWPDYVFAPGYALLPLPQLRQYIADHGHLPNVPSAQAVAEAGTVDLAEMNRVLVEKVEELTLYLLQLQARLEALEEK